MSDSLSDPAVAVAALVVIWYLAFVIVAIRDSLRIERRCRELVEKVREIAEEIEVDV